MATTHSQQAKTAVLLVNLGTPETPTAKGVRKFLKEFLSDRRVVEVPRVLWWPILNGFILPFRPKKVAEAYRSIWLEEGSPLRVITEQQCEALKAGFSAQDPAPEVHYAMTYGEPGIAQQLQSLSAKGIEKIAVIPLYPQYSATTTAAISDQIAQWQLQQRNIADIRLCKSYYGRASYIEALASSVREFWQQNGQAEKLLMSFHGIPKRCVDLGDPYFEHCTATAEHLAEALGLNKNQWEISFQSRLGKAEWLKPYTTDVVKQWGQQGIKSVNAICPAFAVDCLETLEEIAEEAAEDFKNAGGQQFSYIPCLNTRPDHIDLFSEIATELLSY